jgi:glucose-1-phosphatase
MQEIQTILFDLGGVIIDLHPERTFAAFATLLNKSDAEMRNWYEEATFFKEYEKGLITDTDFRNHIRSYVKHPLSDEAIDQAWNAMLGIIPNRRIEWVKQIAGQKQVMVLSNTNHIHIRAFNEILFHSSGHSELHEIFDVVYFSQMMGMRKPDNEIFSYILDKHQLVPSEVLFLDDSLANIRAAHRLGICTLHIDRPDEQISSLATKVNGR